MKPHTLALFIKQKSREIDELSAKIHTLNQKLKSIEQSIEQNLNKLENIQQLSINTIFCLQNKKEMQKEIRYNIKRLKKKAAQLQHQIEENQQTLYRLYSEKSALEKMLKKQEAWERYKQIQKENELANESFIRENFINK